MSAKEYKRKQAEWAKRRASIRSLVANGASMADVGRRYRITRARVYQILKRAGT